jgi:hypothetical protein
MKSGNYSISRDDEYYRKEFNDIENRDFVQRTFVSQPALVANDGRQWREYNGEAFDSSKFHLVEGMWDHEHCSACFFTIKDGYTYWENRNRLKILCDACHEAMPVNG